MLRGRIRPDGCKLLVGCFDVRPEIDKFCLPGSGVVALEELSSRRAATPGLLQDIAALTLARDCG
jgi:hypothetical protein